MSFFHSLMRVADIGVTEDMSFPEASRIRLLNVFAVMAISCNLPFSVYYFREGHPLWPLMLIGVLVYALALWLNHRQRYVPARFGLFAMAFLTLVLTSMAHGRAAGDHLQLIPVLFGAMLIFEFRNRLQLIGVISLTLGSIYLLEFTDYGWLHVDLTPQQALLEYRLNLTITIIFSGVIAGYYYTLYAGQLAQNEEMVDAAREMEQTITYFSTSLFGRNTEEEILWDVVENCIGRLGFAHCVIYLLDEERQVLVEKAAHGPKRTGNLDRAAPAKVAVGQGVAGRAAESARPIVDNRVGSAGAAIAVPMAFRDRVLGVIASEHPQRGFFTARHLNILKTIAALCTNKLLRARAEEVERQARDTRLEAERIKALDEVKSRFFANITHEFRTPLTLIMGPLRDRLAGDLSAADRREWRLMYHNADRLLRLINQLLDLSRLEAGQMEVRPAGLAIFEFLRLTADSFAPLMEAKGIVFEQRLPAADLVLHCDSDILEKVVGNLLSNAFKYTAAGGKVVLEAAYEAGSLRVVVSDTGRGIPPAELSKIFERFYRSREASEYSPGSGIGLSLSRDLIELHGGQLEVSSEAGRGSVFTVVLPLQTASAPAQGAPKRSGVVPAVPGPAAEAAPEAREGEERIALVVEDHAQLRAYITRHLRADFHILQAADGRQALSIAKRQVPDIIISDVVMPEMDGIELCRQIRRTEKTAHIPVILLTARADRESKLNGLRRGADDYLTKPFDGEELQARVRNMLKRRDRLTEKYAKMIVLQPREMVIDSEDAVFLKKAVQAVEEHLDDADFTAESFSKVMHMSRMQLHRKLKALTKLSTMGFVRRIRLERAAQLLASGRHNISTVAYAVGFSNLSYFGKCFRDQFQISPSEYMQPKS